MNKATECILWAIAALGLAALGVVFGMNLLPTAESVESRLGTAMPLVVTWVVIGMTVVAAIALAGFLLVTALKQKT
jgi:hypothetical protein